MHDITIVIAGAAGYGLHTVGALMAKTLSKGGYGVFTWQEYESRIRGGSNSYRIRIGDVAQNAPREGADILLSLDKKSGAKYLPLLADDGILLAESGEAANVIAIPFLDVAREVAGDKLYGNSVAIGALCALLSLPYSLLAEVIVNEFSPKGEEVVQKNEATARAGYTRAEEKCRGCGKHLEAAEKQYHLISGSEAVAIGAAAAGCRFMAAYPMSPSTAIITYLTKHSQKLQIFTEQAEDEIAAINMAIGASYAGTRAMTATSGGGYALMAEGISLAGMTETPVVVVIAQRPGPATGLPTRTEQGDLLFTIFSAHGEFPKLVMAPSDPKNAIYLMSRAFALADKFQIPALVLTDQFMADAVYSIDDFELQKLELESHVAATEGVEKYKRYQLTDSGISPRLYPGQSSKLVCCDSDEHDEYGNISEDLQLRNKMVEKRLRKLALLRKEIAAPEEHLCLDAELILLSWGSSRNSVGEAVGRMRGDGIKAGMVHFTELWPLPSYVFPGDRKYCTVESNATGQLAFLLHNEYGLKIERTLRRYDGLPLDADYILERFNDGR